MFSHNLKPPIRDQQTSELLYFSQLPKNITNNFRRLKAHGVRPLGKKEAFFDQKRCLTSSISPYNITSESGHRKKGNDHQVKKLIIAKQILPINTIRNVTRTERRMQTLSLKC